MNEKSEIQQLIEKMLEVGNQTKPSEMAICCAALPVIQALTERNLEVDDAALLCVDADSRKLAIIVFAAAMIAVAKNGEKGIDELLKGLMK